MKKYMVRITLRRRGGEEEEFRRVFCGYDVDSICRTIEDMYNGDGLCGYEIEKQLFNESEYEILV